MLKLRPLVIVLALFILALLAWAGCSNRNAPIDERTRELDAWVDSMRELGVGGRLIFIWGSGHIAGASYNLSGSNGFAEVWLNPPASQPAERSE